VAAVGHVPTQLDQQLKGYALEAPQPRHSHAPSTFDEQPSRAQIPQSRPRAPSPEPEGGAPAQGPPTHQAANGIPRRKRGRMDPSSERVGRMRLLSRQVGNREATPDQDDIRAASDDDDGDVLAVVAAAVQRDRLLEEELGTMGGVESTRAGGHQYSSEGEGVSSDDDMHHEHTVGGVDIVDFDYGGDKYPEVRDRKKVKRERRQGMHTDNVAVRPGALTHAGPTNGAATALDSDVFGGGDSEQGQGGETFEALGISEMMAAHLRTLGFAVPTRVQRHVVPVLLVSVCRCLESSDAMCSVSLKRPFFPILFCPGISSSKDDFPIP